MLDQAREERGRGIPLTDEERTRRHYEQYGTEILPPRGSGLSSIAGIPSTDEVVNWIKVNWGWLVAIGAVGAIAFAIIRRK